MSLPSLSPEDIRRGATDESYTRGVTYARSGAVDHLGLRGDVLSAEVQGSEDEPYQVTVTLADGAVHAADCTCPYDWGGWCKHIVATLLVASAKPGDVAVRPPLADLLAPLDRDQLLDLVLRLAAREPRLADQVDALLVTSVPVTAVPVPDSGVRAAISVDLGTFQRQVRAAFGGARYDDYRAAGRIAGGLETLADQIRRVIVSDGPVVALPLLEVLTAEVSERWVDYDDSDGLLGDFFDTLGKLWAEVLLAADLPRAAHTTWVRKLEAWADEAAEYGVEGFEVALRAAEEGWDAPWLRAALRGEPVTRDLEEDGSGEQLLSVRLEILVRTGRADEALRLAAATGRQRDAAQFLVRLDRADEAVTLAGSQFQTAAEALALAQALAERGDPERARVVAERGLELAPPRAALARRLFERAVAEGRGELAIRTGEAALLEAPDLALYQRVAEVAGAGWPPVRERVLATLRRTTADWDTARGQVDIWLHEGRIDDAIRVVKRGVAAGELMRVMDAAIATRPEWVIATALKQATAIMDAGTSSQYDLAIAWLTRARAAYQASGQPDAWRAQLEALRAKHRRKYKLMDLLARLERASPR